jgi:hypothetical protein
MEIDDKKFADFKGEFFQFVKDENRQTRDLLMQEMKATEVRFDKQLDKQKDEILEAVGDMLGGSIVPQIDDHEQRLTKLEAKTI